MDPIVGSTIVGSTWWHSELGKGGEAGYGIADKNRPGVRSLGAAPTVAEAKRRAQELAGQYGVEAYPRRQRPGNTPADRVRT